MYTSLRGEDGVFGPVTNLGCRVNGAADEASPMPFRDGKNGRILYFSSVRPGGFAADAPGALIGDSDLYSSTWDGTSTGRPSSWKGRTAPRRTASRTSGATGSSCSSSATGPGRSVRRTSTPGRGRRKPSRGRRRSISVRTSTARQPRPVRRCHGTGRRCTSDRLGPVEKAPPTTT